MATTVGQLTIEMAANIVRLQQDMDKAKNTVAGAMQSIQKSASMAATALGAIGVGLSVAAFTGWIRSAIDAADETNKMAQKIGVAVKDVAGLQLAFRQAGIESGALQTSMSKLSVAIANGNDALVAMNINTRNTDGTLKSTRQVLGEVADKFKSYEDGASKTALAVQLFGKAGAELIPLLNAGSDSLDQFDEMARKLGLTLTAETAARAEKFNDTLDLMGQGFKGIAMQVAADLLPTLEGLADQFFSSMTEGDRLKRIAEGLSIGLKGLYITVVLVYEAVETMVDTLYTAGRQIYAVMSGDIQGAMKLGTEWSGRMKTNWTSALEEVDKAWKANGSTAVSTMTAISAATRKEAPYVSDALKKQTEELKKQEEAYLKLITSIDEKVATNKLEVNSSEKLTESQKLEIKYLNDIEAGTLKLTKAQQDNLFAKLKGLKATEDAITLAKREKDILDDSAKSNLAFYDALVKKNKSIEEEVEKQKESNKEMLLGADAVAQLAIEKLREQAISADRIATIMDEINPDVANAYRDQAIALRELADAREEGIGAKAARESADAWKKTSESIQTSLTDALMRGFESGKDFGKNLKDALFNMFRTLVLTPIIQPIASGASSILLSMMGMNVANAATGGDGGGASTAMSGVALSMSTFGEYLAVGFKNAMYGTFGGGVEATQMLAANGSYAQAAGMGAGTVAGYAAGAAVGVYGGRAIGGGYSLNGGTGNGTINAGTAIGMVLGGPIGAAIGGAIAGTVNRAFGRKQTDIGIEGTLSTSEGIEGQTYKFLKGGWFRSNKTIKESLSNDIEVMFDSSIELITKQTKFYANALGLPAQAIDTFTQSIKLSFQGLTEEEINQKIADALVSFQEGLVSQYADILAPLQLAGETFAQTLERLSIIQEVSVYLNEFGGAFSTFANASVQARQGIIELAGGLDELVKKTQGFVANFYSKEEQAGITAKGVVQALTESGFTAAQIAALETRADFRSLLESIDVTNTQGQEQFVALLDVATTFAELTPIMEEQSKSLVELIEAAPQVEILQKMFESDSDYQNRVASAEELAQATLTSMETLLGDLNINVSSLSTIMANGLDNIASANQSALNLANSALASANSAISSANASAASVISALDAITSSAKSEGVVVTQQLASGGQYNGGMALVGESGPELIDLNSSGTVYSASQSANIVGGEVAGEIRALREEVSLLRYEARSTAVNTSKIARLQDNWDVRGLTVKTDVDQPLDTVAV